MSVVIMQSLSTASDQLVEPLTQRLAELLNAQVVALDERGSALSIAQPRRGITPPADALAIHARAPLTGRDAHLIITPLEESEPVSERLVQAIVDVLAEQTSFVARLPNHDELKYRFIHSLLQGDMTNEEHVLREAQILGMDLSRPRSVLLIDASEYICADQDEATVRRRAQTVILSIVRFFSLPNATICAYIGDGEVAVLKASGTQDLAAWTDRCERLDQCSPSWANLGALKRAGAALVARIERDIGAPVSVGIGRYHPGLHGLAWSYRDARAALTLGSRAEGAGQIHCLDGLGAAAFVGLPDEQTKVDLAVHLLTPLDQDPDLLETLEAYFAENCSPSVTSRRLAIHRNTLSYRLDKITSLTGLDPRQFDQAIQIRLALLLRSLGIEPNDRTAVPPVSTPSGAS